MKAKFRYILLLLFLFSVAVAQEDSSVFTPRVFFSSLHQIEEELIKLINAEKHSIQIAVYNFTHYGIAKALKQAFKRGVSIEILVDPTSVKSRSPLNKMTDMGIPIFVFHEEGKRDSKYLKPLMHHKFCLFGSGYVWTGSCNLTKQASLNNKENAVLLFDFDLLKNFQEEFEEIKMYSSISYEKYIKTVYKKTPRKSLIKK